MLHYGGSPRKKDYRSCNCGHLWNTFDTGGVCLACLYQWTSTHYLALNGPYIPRA
jgi:hypothetical protein